MLELKKLCKTFSPNTPDAHCALDQLDLRLAQGEFLTIIGSNGAGKSTLFNAVCGNFELDSGRILLQGQDITFLPEHKRAAKIGRLFQDPMKGTAPNMTIAENLALAYSRSTKGIFRLGVRRKDLELFRDRLAAFGLGLEDRMQAKAGLLSGGQRQVLSLLMTTIAKPQVLLLDEHTAALDPATAHKIMEITKQIVREENLTTMMITHNIQAALTTGDRTVMLDRGRIILDIAGQQRENMSVPELMALYAQQSEHTLDNDRMLLAG
ncbi:MAG: ATP-binding cassette domain-containing protein [Anaerotruncus sp.]|nr:ATP-binding cassette domain-containing protein [Anaerotruncus sp.]